MFLSIPAFIRKGLVLISVLLCVIIGVTAFEIYISTNWLNVTRYEISSDKVEDKVTICLLADLHDHEFGEDNCQLVEMVSKETPDLIILCGDFLNKYSEDDTVPLTLIPQLKAIAPVYFTFGNQELDYMVFHEDLAELLENVGAVILDEEMTDIEIDGTSICLAGMYDYAFALDGAGHMDKNQIEKEKLSFLETFQAKDSFTIMSAHRPDSFVFGQAADTWNIDLVLSGHLHGGQVIIPFVGGLYAGDQGFFPEYDFGIYHFDAVKNMIITKGLGSDKEKLPRFNNIPEIVVITLVEAQKTSVN